ncbi:MAG: hypothetical protein HY531_01135 [Chloroflexi bacterium]|nr:hypothetical protein [Chloroflexota bacterium]
MRATLLMWGGIALLIASVLGSVVWLRAFLGASQGTTLLSVPLSVQGQIPVQERAAPSYLLSLTDGIEWPLAVVASPDGSTYVADGACRCVRVFDQSGRPMATFGPEASEEELQYPVALALDEGGTLYVSDLAGGRIYRLREGASLESLSVGDIPRTVLSPAGLLIQDGVLYVNDLSRHQVLMFNLQDGSLVRVIGAGKGRGVGELAYPNFSLLLADGSILVADSNNHRLQHFGPLGDMRTQWEGQVSVPRGLARDGDGNIHVASTMAGRIEVFASTGEYMGGYDQLAGGPGTFAFPTGIDIVGDTIYVADRGNGRVLIGRLPGKGEIR